MAVQTRSVLKTYFETGDKPTSAQFGDLIDSALMANVEQATATQFSAQPNTIYDMTTTADVRVMCNAVVPGDSFVVNKRGSSAVCNSSVDFICVGDYDDTFYADGYADVTAIGTGIMSYAVLIAISAVSSYVGIGILINRTFYSNQ